MNAMLPLPVADRTARSWMPKFAYATAAARNHEHGRRIIDRLRVAGVDVVELKANRLPPLKKASPASTYATSKRTLAIVNAPPGQFKLQPIPPSADYQFHLAQGCPAHCQYCYLAGSLTGPPITRVYANLQDILENTTRYDSGRDETTYEVSCYTDPLGIEPACGSLAETIRFLGSNRSQAGGVRRTLRWVTKFDDVSPLVGLPHRGRTRCRFSINADAATGRIEGGTASVPERLAAAARLADDGYPVGLVVAPIMPTGTWQRNYEALFDLVRQHLGHVADVTFELITHRFTPGSKDQLLQWYPKTKLDLDESTRAGKRNKFGGIKYVYEKELMSEMKNWFVNEIERKFVDGRVLYWT